MKPKNSHSKVFLFRLAIYTKRDENAIEGEFKPYTRFGIFRFLKPVKTEYENVKNLQSLNSIVNKIGWE